MTSRGPAPPGLRRARSASLTTRITLWYGALLGVCLVTFSIVTGLSFQEHVSAELDRRVHEDIELAARALVVGPGGALSWAGGSLGKQVPEEEGGGHWIEVFGPEGTRLLADGSLGPVDLGPPRPPAGGRQARTEVVGGVPLRIMTEAIDAEGRHFLARAAVSEVGARWEVRALWRRLGLTSGVVLALGWLGGLVLTRRALRPLARMAAHAGRVEAGQLHERLAVEDSALELDQLRDAFNDTLARLERSFEQLRRFTADASHELRTPLTALRSVGEVGLRGARGEGDYREVISTMLEEVDRLSRLADELLMLARAESGQLERKHEPVDLAGLVADVVERLGVLAEEREQRLETAVLEGVEVSGDRVALRQALMNLVDNAIKYAPEGTRIQVRAGTEGGAAFLEVSDEGTVIAKEHRERVFERFYRVDSSRSRELGGTGLGLSLVKWAAESHGGRAVLRTGEPYGNTFRVELPLPAGRDRKGRSVALPRRSVRERLPLEKKAGSRRPSWVDGRGSPPSTTS